jgi:hypothetical protein
MAVLEYYVGGKLQRLTIQSITNIPKSVRGAARSPAAARARAFAAFAPQALEAVQQQAGRFGAMLGDVSESAIQLSVAAVAGAAAGTAIVPTASLVRDQQAQVRVRPHRRR